MPNQAAGNAQLQGPGGAVRSPRRMAVEPTGEAGLPARADSLRPGQQLVLFKLTLGRQEHGRRLGAKRDSADRGSHRTIAVRWVSAGLSSQKVARQPG